MILLLAVLLPSYPAVAQEIVAQATAQIMVGGASDAEQQPVQVTFEGGRRNIDLRSQRDLDFGVFVSNHGLVQKLRTDHDAGRFFVSAQPAQTSHLRLEIDVLPPPNGLEGPGQATLPYTMKVARRIGQNSPATATEVQPPFSVHYPPVVDCGYRRPEVYVYVYGSVEVGFAEAGDYQAPVTLQATLYDEGTNGACPSS